MTLIPANHKEKVHLNKSNDKDFYLNYQNLGRYFHSAVSFYAEKLKFKLWFMKEQFIVLCVNKTALWIHYQ